ncbi:MAG: TonB-dependent receptor, partial [Mediterranea sp.]|nr:TonB-dependent receptor [Mediterranea sp.]
VAFLMLTTIVNAQVTTASMSGKVTSSDESIIGATVLAVHEPSGSRYGVTTNVDGRFSLQGMRTGGPYKVEISYIGYNTATYTNVFLQLGEIYELDVELSESTELLGEVIVIGDKSSRFMSQRTGAAENFNARALANTPSISRSVFDIAKMIPQANKSNNGNGFSIGGANGRYNSFQIDGTVNNDVFGLSDSGTNGGQAGANPISLDAIEELQVVIAPFDVRQSGFTGGGINAITKSGTNDFHATVYGYYNDENFAGTTAGKHIDDRKKLTEQSDKTYGISVGGPILKNKLFYFVNFERAEKDYPSSYTINDGSQIKEADAIAVQNKISELTGGKYNGGSYGSRSIPTESYKLMARMDWNINDKHKFTLRYNYLDAQKLSYSNSTYALRFADNGYWMNNKTHSFVTELHSRFSNTVYNEFRAGWTQVRDERTTDGLRMPYIIIYDLPSIDGTKNDATIALGTENYSGANKLDQDIFTIADNVTLNYGTHNITIGTHNEIYNMGNMYITNATGYYNYNSLSDFLSIGTANEVKPYQYQYSYAKPEITGNKLWMPTFGAAQAGIYAQDEWQVADNFKLTYGLRIDMPIYFDKPSANETFNNSDIAKKYDVATNKMPKSLPLFAPRIGFRWNLDKEKKALLRGGLGVFTGRVPFVWISNSFSNTGVEMVQYNLKANSVPNDFKFNIDPEKQYDPALTGASAQTSTVCVMADDFKMPQILRANLAFEYRLPYDIKATIEGLYSKTLNNVYYQNIQYENLNGETLNNGNDKRPYYTNMDKGYYGIYYLSNTSKGFTASLTAKLEKTFDFGLDLMAAYTHTRSKSLNDGNSSQAASNWGKNFSIDGNNPTLESSTYDLPHRVIGSIGYSKSYAKYFATHVNLTYTGQSGDHYNLTYTKDINGDGYANDVLYVPTDEELKTMNFNDYKTTAGVTIAADKQREDFGKWINDRPDVAKRKGDYIRRNAMIAAFENHFDFHLAQDFYFFIKGRKNTVQLNFDILNVGNLLNRGWGLYNNVSWNYNVLDVVSLTNRTPVFNFKGGAEPSTISDYNSRWRAQIGVKYIF